MSFMRVCRALREGGELVSSNATEAVFRRESKHGPVFFRVLEPGRVEVASSPAGRWTAATHTITTQLDRAGNALLEHDAAIGGAAGNLSTQLADARAMAGRGSADNLVDACSRAQSVRHDGQRASPSSPYLPAPGAASAPVQALPGVSTQGRRVLEWLRLVGSYGGTDDEMQVALDMSPNTQRPRRIELLEAGLIRSTGTYRKTRTGRRAAVWVAVTSPPEEES